jgi:hypothetical protein
MFTVLFYFRLPARLIVPSDVNSNEYDKHIIELKKRLAANKIIKQSGLTLDTEDDLKKALNHIAIQSDEDIKKTASIVFVSTALSQSGKLDGLIVLVLLSKMIWRIAHKYNQRPGPREMLQLYANVAGTALVAMEIEEIDIGEQIEPVIENVVGTSIAGAIPGFQQISSFVFGCIMEGTMNAYLTLRVGAVTKSYCGSLVKAERKTIRRMASIEAAAYLGRIVGENAYMVSKKIFASLSKKYSDKIRRGSSNMISRLKFTKKEE